MLILPIVNRNRVMNVHITLKDAEKIRKGVSFDDAVESDIIVNRARFSDSSLSGSKDVSAPVDFIRGKSLLYPRNYLITTKEEADSTLYDVYEVSPPPKKVSDGLDNLYSSVITDMRKEIPNSKRGRYVSFEKLGVHKELTDEKIEKLQQIVRETKNEKEWPFLFREAGISDLKDAVDFINIFDCTVVSDTSIPEDSLQTVLKGLEAINTKDARSLRNYYNMALSNKEIYAKLSYINKIIYNEPLSLIRSRKQKEKQLVKTKDESELSKSA